MTTLRAVGESEDFEVRDVERVTLNGRLVTSTLIRKMIGAGRVREAARALGRWYSIEGRVVRGMGRGRSLGFPTLNLICQGDHLLPEEGIYAGWARWRGREHPAAVYIGRRPTFPEDRPRLAVEAHILEPSLRRPPQSTVLSFAERLRADRRWGRVEDLVEQMGRDIKAARRVLLRNEGAKSRA